MPILRLAATLARKFGKIYRTKGFSRLRSDLNRAALAIKIAAMQDDETSPAAALARFQLTLSSCVRCRSGLRAAPFSEQACGLVVLLQPFREPFVAKASHTIAVVSSRERCLRVASSFLEHAKLDQRCCRAPEPASEFFLRCYCLPIAWTAASLTACARSSFMLPIAPASRLFGLIAHHGIEHYGIARNPTPGKPSGKPNAGPNQTPCQYIRGQGHRG